MPAASPLEPLIRDLVAHCAAEPRTLAGVLDAWRTSCPRLTVFEDAVDGGYLERRYVPDTGWIVEVTDAGRALVARPGHATTIT